MRTRRTDSMGCGVLCLTGWAASVAPAAVRRFHVLFGAGETIARHWDGRVRVADGVLVHLREWTFQSPDAAGARVAVRFETDVPDVRHVTICGKRADGKIGRHVVCT